jgi:hypothetical protein
MVHKEAQKLIQLIMKDIVLSWYHKISHDEELPLEVVRILEYIACDVQSRLQHVNVNQTINTILPLIDPYITALNEVGFINERGKLTFDVTHPNCTMLFEKKSNLVHYALKNKTTEIEHLEKLVDAYIISGIPPCYRSCDIAVQFIRDAFVYRVLAPLVNLLCQPDFLLKTIPLILAKASDDKIKRIMALVDEENKVLDEQLALPLGLMSPYAISDVISQGGLSEDLESYPWPRESFRSPSIDDANDGPVIVPLPSIYITRNVNVEATDGVHTGYIIRFPEQMINAEAGNDNELESLKRYSEFVQLHKSFISDHKLSHYAKTLNLPDRKIFANIWSKTPFSTTEQDVTIILERQDGLQKYLQELVVIESLKNSDTFKDFLMSGVKMLQNANIVTAKSKRWNIWSMGVASNHDNNTNANNHYIGDVLNTFVENNLPVTSLAIPNSYEYKRYSMVAMETSPAGRMTPFDHMIEMAASIVRGQPSEDTSMTDEVEEKCPLMNRLLSLANEATRTTSPELWITSESIQLTVLAILGSTLDDLMTQELHEVISDDMRWTRSLYNLRHLLWPDGHLKVSGNVVVSDDERAKLKQDAVHEIKTFLPSNSSPSFTINSTD